MADSIRVSGLYVSSAGLYAYNRFFLGLSKRLIGTGNLIDKVRINHTQIYTYLSRLDDDYND